MELEELNNLKPTVVRAAARVMARKCLVEGDMILHSVCLEVMDHPDNVRKLVDTSPQFRRELLKQKEIYDGSRLG